MRWLTNKAARYEGETVVVSVRLMRPVVDVIDEALGQPGLGTRSDFLQHWATVGAMIEQRSHA